MKRKILIIGGNGFIGSNLLKLLVTKNYDVYSFDIQKPQNGIEGVEYIIGDFFDIETLERITDGMDVIIHSLSTVNPGNSNVQYMHGYEKDFIQTVRLCEIVIKKKIKMIFLSSGGTVYGNQEIQPIKEDVIAQPINHYGNIKLCIENTIRTFNTQLHTKMLIARISNPYGPGQDYNKGVGFIDAVIKKALKGETIEIWGDGNIERDYIFIDDACKMIEALVDYDGAYEVFNISLNKAVSQNQIIQMLRENGVETEVKYTPARSVDAKKIVLDNTRIMQVYKQKPVDIDEGIKLYYEYIKNSNR